ncbi:MAG: DUF6576 domain-containing protein, partial [Phycisphaerales bacterium]
RAVGELAYNQFRAGLVRETPCPVADSLWERGLYLPSDHRLTSAELDRILDKIARSGIESLTSAERATLERATDEKRRREQGG